VKGLSKRHAPVAVLLAPEVHSLYVSLKGQDELKKTLDKGLDLLKERMFVGEKIEKRLIPKYYVDKYGVNNLFRLRLDRARRLVYTIVADEEGVKVAVLEVFLDHKSYGRRFGYRTG